MDYTLLANVHEHSQEWTVKVRVTRLCKHSDPQQPSEIMRLSFVLLDETSTIMDGEVQKEWVKRYLAELQENSMYYISFFRVVDARNSYAAVNRPIMARLTRYTEICEITPPPADFPLYACSLATFEELKQRHDETTYCSDVIGILTGCSHSRIQYTKGGHKNLRNVYISDGSETASVALWGSHAEEFPADEYMSKANENPKGILFVGVTFRMYRGSLSVHGSTICKWFIDPDLPEARSLREKYIALNGNFTQPTWHGSALPAPEAEQTTVEFLSAVSNPHTIYHKKYMLNIKIKCLKPKQMWWYHACAVCTKSAIPEGDAYKCTVRKCGSTRGGPRYRLALIAIDPATPMHDANAPYIELVVFGPKAEELLGTPVNSLIAAQSSLSFLPDRIKNLYGKEFQVRISLSPSSLDRPEISFQVSSILPAPAIPVPTINIVNTGDANAPIPGSEQPTTLPTTSAMSPAQATSQTAQGSDELHGRSTLTTQQDIIQVPEQSPSTPPPQQTPESCQVNAQKRCRETDITAAEIDEESMPIVGLTREKT